jgi:DNA-binding GntR family transcriptional regulator
MNEVSAAVPLASQSEDASASRRKGRLHGAAVAGLREMIVTGALKPGQRLVEKQLCEHFAISRTPLREALKTLATEGLVRLLPNRSAVVAELDLAEIEALYDVTATLEIHAASLACAQASDAGIAEFGALHYAMVARFHAGDLSAYFDINQQVHRKLVELAGNPVLLWVWDILAVRVRRAKFLPHLTPNRGDAAVEEHEAIFAALASRDTEHLVACVRAHFDSGLVAIRRGPAATPHATQATSLQA